jgi:8-oxo-dGTP diphosphatase
MANSKLTGTYYQVPENILSEISNTLKGCKEGYPGKKKGEFLVREKKLSYENLRRYKNFFDNYNRSKYDLGETDTLNEINPEMDYKLRGGKLMRDFVENKLKEITEKIKSSKQIKRDYAGLDNQFKKEKEYSNIKINTNNNFIKTESLIRESSKNKPNKMLRVSLTVIFNEENKVLLLKRSENTDWCPNCWALVGGKIEKNETPEEGLVREVKEETKIKLEKFKLKKIIKFDNVLEYLYLSKVNNNFVELNSEHSDYRWYSLDEIKEIDNKVPELLNYIKYVIL